MIFLAAYCLQQRANANVRFAAFALSHATWCLRCKKTVQLSWAFGEDRTLQTTEMSSLFPFGTGRRDRQAHLG